MVLKRGQATAAAVLVGLIAAFLVLFIVLLPPAERAKILDDKSLSNFSTGSSGAVSAILVRESPGRIDYFAQRQVEHPIPVINLFTTQESKVLAEKNVAQIKKGSFSSDEDQFSFSIADLANTKNVLLGFSVEEIEGRLIVSLNGQEVYNADTTAGSITPIPLPTNVLQSQNMITFQISSPGAAFWSTNGARLVNIKVVGDVTGVRTQSSRNTFLVSETERENLERAVLKFQPECRMGEVGRLRVSINGNELYSGVPDCDVAMVPIEIPPADLSVGENDVTFFTESGVYILSHVQVESRLRELDFPTYYFELSEEQFNDIREKKSAVKLRLDFVDVVKSKRGQIIFNGHARHFDTKETSEVIEISEDVVRGTNSVKIKPQQTLEVRELRVDLVK